ncbi:four helix bundle protein [Patescibacteria group bacterium]|nr:MAG: four helix bundle protein [Patescibacteria group bacterium]
MLIHESSVFQATYDVLKDLHVARRSFAKSEKYALGERMEETLLNVLLGIIDAGQAKQEWKLTGIDAALRELEKTKILLRLASDLGQIQERRLISYQESLQKIGRMLGGWRRAI